MKPNLIVRKGNKFILDESKILPYMRGSKDLILAAVAVACNELKEDENPESDAKKRLQSLNDRVYHLLEVWKVYKG